LKAQKEAITALTLQIAYVRAQMTALAAYLNVGWVRHLRHGRTRKEQFVSI